MGINAYLLRLALGRNADNPPDWENEVLKERYQAFEEVLSNRTFYQRKEDGQIFDMKGRPVSPSSRANEEVRATAQNEFLTLAVRLAAEGAGAQLDDPVNYTGLGDDNEDDIETMSTHSGFGEGLKRDRPPGPSFLNDFRFWQRILDKTFIAVATSARMRLACFPSMNTGSTQSFVIQELYRVPALVLLIPDMIAIRGIARFARLHGFRGDIHHDQGFQPAVLPMFVELTFLLCTWGVQLFAQPRPEAMLKSVALALRKLKESEASDVLPIVIGSYGVAYAFIYCLGRFGQWYQPKYNRYFSELCYYVDTLDIRLKLTTWMPQWLARLCRRITAPFFISREDTSTIHLTLQQWSTNVVTLPAVCFGLRALARGMARLSLVSGADVYPLVQSSSTFWSIYNKASLIRYVGRLGICLGFECLCSLASLNVQLWIMQFKRRNRYTIS